MKKSIIKQITKEAIKNSIKETIGGEEKIKIISLLIYNHFYNI